MENNGPFTPGNGSTDMGAVPNMAQAVGGQSISRAHVALAGNATIRGPQHVGIVPQQLLAPLFPAGAIINNGGQILSADIYAQLNLANGRAAGLPTSDSFQAMVMPPTLSGQPTETFNNKQEKTNSNASVTEYSASERAKQNRDRNREHARSTRLRKKAYVAKLKDLVEGLHSQRTEDMRQRRVAIQHLSEVQSVRRNVVRNFLNYFSSYERDERKWVTIIEDKFWLKEPVTPYRSFRRAEIEKDCHLSKGLESLLCNAASLAVMVESIGSRSSRWMQLKRQEVIIAEEAQRGNRKAPPCLVKQSSRLQHAISSLSSNSEILSGEGSNSASEEKAELVTAHKGLSGDAAKVSSSSGSSNDGCDKKEDSSNVYHDYNAQPLPDPKLDEEERNVSSGEGSPEDEVDSTKRADSVTDSSSGDDAVAEGPALKKQKVDSDGQSSDSISSSVAIAAPRKTVLGPSIARKGGIPHNIAPVMKSTPLTASSDRLKTAPAVALPPFTGLGKRSSAPVKQAASENDAASANGNGTASVSADAESSSLSSDSNKSPRTTARFHINEDDMIMMDNVLMCPFVFRSCDAVLCGALSECVMPGMLRAQFSNRNKLLSMEMVYDSMGFMQQLERANGNEGAAQIVPGSLEMALTPSSTEARVITLAKSPFLIVNVNDLWTQTTGYTQMEVEGKPYLSLLDGEATLKPACDMAGKPYYDLDEVAKGRSACMANIHYDKFGKDFIEFVCSYPLTNSNDETTHLLHVSKELPSEHGASNTHMSRVS